MDDEEEIKQAADPNIEWKNAGTGSRERPSLKSNELEAAYVSLRREKGKTIRSALLDDESLQKIKDESAREEYKPSYKQEEKSNRQLKEQKLHMDLQQKNAKATAIITADKLAKTSGLKGVNKTTAAKAELDTDNLQDVFFKMVKQDIVKRLKIRRGMARLRKQNVARLFYGVKRIQAVGGQKALRGMPLQYVQKAGRKTSSDKRIAQLILLKSGRKQLRPKKRLKYKSSRTAQREFNQVMMKKTALSALGQ